MIVSSYNLAHSHLFLHRSGRRRRFIWLAFKRGPNRTYPAATSSTRRDTFSSFPSILDPLIVTSAIHYTNNTLRPQWHSEYHKSVTTSEACKAQVSVVILSDAAIQAFCAGRGGREVQSVSPVPGLIISESVRRIGERFSQSSRSDSGVDGSRDANAGKEQRDRPHQGRAQPDPTLECHTVDF